MIDSSSNGSPAVPDVWTVLSLMEWAQAYLVQKGFDEARLHVELLLCQVLGLTRLQLYLQFDRPLITDELSSFKAVFKRRLAHEPLQYILGETVFMGLPIYVGPGVLIPRPETELLVEKTIEVARSLSRPEPAILDVGTGSGNIAIALAHFLPSARVTAIDSSDDALGIAGRNIERNGVPNVTLQQSDFRSGLASGQRFDLIVSNPPYIALEEFEQLQPEIREFEPRSALTDEGDGLGFFRIMFAVARETITPDGHLLCEFGAGQERAVDALAASSGWAKAAVTPDLAGIPRVFHARPDLVHG